MKTIVELKNVSVRYESGKSNETIAVRNVSLKIYEGEYIIFLGQSGCGKSTLLYTIAGLEAASEGEIMVGNRNLKDIKEGDLIDFYRNTIGMIFQAFYLVPHLTVADNIMLSKIFSGVSVIDREKKAKELMDKFGISSYSQKKPSSISGGQQQRTAIARALMNDPEIILADEPVGNLDTKNAEIVLELLSSIHKNENKTIIQVTHNPLDVRFADRVFYMKDGAIERVVENTEKGREASRLSMESLKDKNIIDHIDEQYKKIKTNGEMSEIEKLALISPNIVKSRLQARYMVRRLLMPYDIDTELKIEEIVEKYIKKEISENQLLELLDKPADGNGLYSQKAKRIVKGIVDIESEILENEEIKKLSKIKNEGVDPLLSQVIVIRRHILDSYSGILSKDQIIKLEYAIHARISDKINGEELRELLDLPVKNGGLGLNSRTAKRFSEEINMIMAK
jgi:putative ABC transport system ATP-binding protein